MKKNRVLKNTVEKSSGNVYSDLCYANSSAMLIKAQLVAKISEIIRSRNLTQAEAASTLGLTQPKISALLKGNFRGISERRLLDCLTLLGHDIQIVIRPIPKSRRTGQLIVLEADAKRRFFRRIRNAHDLGTGGKISWTRDELHER
ncbi:MAG TPA: helix-turn-helix transcriptional regulator [Bryobacteraceae bacterium]|nr:helix-turn-helix transcriptional regulator [Bryobacteraceae bacterium]